MHGQLGHANINSFQAQFGRQNRSYCRPARYVVANDKFLPKPHFKIHFRKKRVVPTNLQWNIDQFGNLAQETVCQRCGCIPLVHVYFHDRATVKPGSVIFFVFSLEFHIQYSICTFSIHLSILLFPHSFLPSLLSFLPSFIPFSTFLSSFLLYFPSFLSTSPLSFLSPSLLSFLPSFSNFLSSFLFYFPSFIPFLLSFLPSFSTFLPSPLSFLPSLLSFLPSLSTFLPSFSFSLPSLLG